MEDPPDMFVAEQTVRPAHLVFEKDLQGG